MRFFGRRKPDPVAIAHYAPDISLTAVDYAPPIPHERRFQNARGAIREFLSRTNPDSLCEQFYDRAAEEEGELILVLLQEQAPDHRDANASIARKHKAELDRLDQALQQVDSAVRACDAELSELQKLYDRCNKQGVTS